MEAVFTPNNSPPVPCLPARVDTAQQANRFSLWLLLAALLIGTALQLFGPAWAKAVFSAVRLDSLSGLSALFAALAAGVVLHEGGHLMAALLMRFQVLGICIGPIRATRSYGRWTIQFSGRLFTGSISAIPRNTERWRERVLVVIAGGPLATLLTGFTAGLLLFYTTGSGWPKTFLAALTELSCFLFVLGLIPNRNSAPVRNDARLFLMVWNETPEARDILLFHLIARLELEGVRPRDYPAGLIRAMAATNGRPDANLVYAHLIALWALDRDDLANALAWDERALELSKSCNVTAQQVTLARSACLDVLIRDECVAAKRKFAAVDLESLSPAWFRHRAKAACCLVEGRIPEALAEICCARYAFPTSLPYYEFERMLLTQLHRKALAYRPTELAARDTNRAA